MTCHNCQTLAKKAGWFISGSQRIQRYRCKQCGKTFGDIPERPLDDLRTPLDKACKVVHLLCEGVGIRSCERLTGLHRDTVLAILETVGVKCARLLDQRLQWIQCEHVQVDELWAFVGCKQRNSQQDEERGDQYTYLGMDKDTKLIISHFVGKRDREAAGFFMRDLRSRITSRFQLSTDGFAAYRGYEGAVFQTWKHDVDFGTIVKLFAANVSQPHTRYSPPQCIGIKKQPECGIPRMDLICTSHVERQNLSMRLFNRRMTRLTMGYSKKLRNLKHSVAIQIAFHNFCRIHSKHGMTPAQAAGLTDRKWEIKELLG